MRNSVILIDQVQTEIGAGRDPWNAVRRSGRAPDASGGADRGRHRARDGSADPQRVLGPDGDRDHGRPHRRDGADDLLRAGALRGVVQGETREGCREGSRRSRSGACSPHRHPRTEHTSEHQQERFRMDTSTKVAESQELGSKVASLLRKRLDSAARDHAARVRAAHERYAKACESARAKMNLQQSWTEPYHYAVDFMQRSILFWDALAPARQRLCREHKRTARSRCCKFRVRDDRRRPQVREAGELRARLASCRPRVCGRSEAAALHHHRSAGGHGPGIARIQGRFAKSASRSRRGIPSISSCSSSIPNRDRRCSTCAKRRKSSCASCASGIPTARSRSSSATARAAGPRRCSLPRIPTTWGR